MNSPTLIKTYLAGAAVRARRFAVARTGPFRAEPLP